LTGLPDARACAIKTQPFTLGACLRSLTRPPPAEPRLTLKDELPEEFRPLFEAGSRQPGRDENKLNALIALVVQVA
jgi:hypothetical protein